MQGLELCRAYFETWGRPMLEREFPELLPLVAAGLMGRRQIRRLPVTENGRLCGMLSLGDLAVKPECSLDAGDALTEISEGLSRRR